MKYKLITMYTNMLYNVENFFATIEQAVNEHRAKIEEKYWEHISNISS